jgi:hypothetical protein
MKIMAKARRNGVMKIIETEIVIINDVARNAIIMISWRNNEKRISENGDVTMKIAKEMKAKIMKASNVGGS